MPEAGTVNLWRFTVHCPRSRPPAECVRRPLRLRARTRACRTRPVPRGSGSVRCRPPARRRAAGHGLRLPRIRRFTQESPENDLSCASTRNWLPVHWMDSMKVSPVPLVTALMIRSLARTAARLGSTGTCHSSITARTTAVARAAGVPAGNRTRRCRGPTGEAGLADTAGVACAIIMLTGSSRGPRDLQVCAGNRGVARQMLLQFAPQDIGQVTDVEPRPFPRHLSVRS